MSDITKIGFIGLGVMGGAMASNMASKGSEEVIVYDISPKRVGEYAEKGMTPAASYADVSRGDVIFTSLPDGEVLESVFFASGGLCETLREGQIFVDLSTVKYSVTLEIERKIREKKAHFLDAPVSGMAARAIDGTLAVMCGGEEAIFEKICPYLRRIGSNIVYMGQIGSGQAAKLINQLLFDINAAAIAEIFPLAVKIGLDPEKTVSIVNSGTGRSFASEFFAPGILKDNFTEGYALQSAYKDLVSACEISSSLGLPLPVLNAAAMTYQMALLKGYGSQNKGSMIHVFEELFGVAFRSKERVQ
ncbi:MAG: NAD(P)-dependent oxidoreductase [Synergistaceae bacterium]|jgi:3-hydroxyisobutyrate dehydrogenase-like beta-hydroxyacid dehydrogenase|nr:NAD(P)-dependent oxidoreductase [Synergistaceae bacterium]